MKTPPSGVTGAILPVQFFPGPSRVRLVPEARLMGAILADAVQVYLDAPPDGPRPVVADVEDWIASDDAGSPFSFRNVCDTLGLDHVATREALRRRRPVSRSRRGRRVGAGRLTRPAR